MCLLMFSVFNTNVKCTYTLKTKFQPLLTYEVYLKTISYKNRLEVGLNLGLVWDNLGIENMSGLGHAS